MPWKAVHLVAASSEGKAGEKPLNGPDNIGDVFRRKRAGIRTRSRPSPTATKMSRTLIKVKAERGFLKHLKKPESDRGSKWLAEKR